VVCRVRAGVYVQMGWNVWWAMTVFLWGWLLRIMFVRDSVFLGAVLWGCLFCLSDCVVFAGKLVRGAGFVSAGVGTFP
jgi:hypothetical protein